MAKFFVDIKQRATVREYISKAHKDFFQWIMNFCAEYSTNKYAEKNVQLYPEELAYCVLVALNDISFIKKVTHIHPLHMATINERLYSQIFILHDICKSPISINGVDIMEFYHGVTVNIILAICRKMEGKSFFYQAMNTIGGTIFDSGKMNLTFCYDSRILQDISSSVEEDIIDLADSLVAYSIIKYCSAYMTLINIKKEQSEKQTNACTIEDLKKQIEQITCQIDDLRKKPLVKIEKVYGTATGDVSEFNALMPKEEIGNLTK